MANRYVIRIKFHWGFSYVTRYMKHYLLATKRVISSIITRNFFVARNKQPMTVGTNRMRRHCANTMCFPRQLPTTARKLFSLLSSTCVIRVVLSVSYLFSFLLCDEFLKTYFSQYATAFEVCVNPVEWKVSKRASKLKILGADRILRPPAKRIQIELYEPHLGKEKPVMGNIEPLLGITKPAEGLNKPCKRQKTFRGWRI